MSKLTLVYFTKDVREVDLTNKLHHLNLEFNAMDNDENRLPGSCRAYLELGYFDQGTYDELRNSVFGLRLGNGLIVLRLVGLTWFDNDTYASLDLIAIPTPDPGAWISEWRANE